MIPVDSLVFAATGVACTVFGWVLGYREGYGDASKWFRVNVRRAMQGKEPIGEGGIIEGSELVAVERDEDGEDQ
ncbi:hypothetical protein [Natrinema salinisoli]|uniref:hypothetical protein n=1 Tax=Natrinema salinisoli TaxID=2878535 RepID=UPI001CF0C0A5|nr:hypothetical protein [Natrinema salinisoli]